MERIAENPFDPPYPCRPYKLHDIAGAWVAVVDERFWLVYQVFADHPWLALRHILDTPRAD